jgi:hypothetical protein
VADSELNEAAGGSPALPFSAPAAIEAATKDRPSMLEIDAGFTHETTLGKVSFRQ